MAKLSDEVKKRYSDGNRYSAEATLKKRQQNCLRWLNKCRKKYKTLFDYFEAEKNYQTQKKPLVEILCTQHNHKFFITPDKHIQLKFGGCEYCERDAVRAGIFKRERQKFLNWFNDNRADRLELVSEFRGMTQLMDFKCLVHNTIEPHLPTRIMSPSSEIWGCSKCATEATAEAGRLDPEKLIQELKLHLPKGVKIHKIEFDEEASATRITLDCEVHGIQKPIGKAQFNRSKEKCATCSKERLGYADARLRKLIESGEKGYPCSIAVMEIEALGIKALKVGVTTRTLEHRYREALKTVFFEARPLEIDAYVLENRIKDRFADEKDQRVLKKGMREGKRWEGDTELYRFKCKERIIDYIKNFISELKFIDLDYEKELKQFIIPTPFPRKSEFEAGEFQGPVPVIGIDPETHKIIYDFVSMQAAADAIGTGTTASNISQVVNGHRDTAGGIRWFRKDKFDPSNIPPIEIPNAKPVYCIERNQHFRSTTEAELEMRKLGHPVSSSKISMVLNNHRTKAGGFTWKYSEMSTQEILSQDEKSFVDYQPPRNSNAPISIRLISTIDPTDIKTFKSLSEAAEFLGSGVSNVSRAKKKGFAIKNYKVEEI